MKFDNIVEFSFSRSHYDCTKIKYILKYYIPYYPPPFKLLYRLSLHVHIDTYFNIIATIPLIVAAIPIVFNYLVLSIELLFSEKEIIVV